VILPAFVWISEFVTYRRGTTYIVYVLNRVLIEAFGNKREEAIGVWRQRFKEDLYNF